MTGFPPGTGRIASGFPPHASRSRWRSCLCGLSGPVLVLAIAVAAGVARAQSGPPATGTGPGSAAWNALYDRIIRLEHEVRALRQRGASAAVASRSAETGSGRVDGRLKALEAELADLRRMLEQRLRDFDRRLRRLEQGTPLRGGKREEPMPSRSQARAGHLTPLPPARPIANAKPLDTLPATDPDLLADAVPEDPTEARMSAEIVRPGRTPAPAQGEQLLGRLRVDENGRPLPPATSPGLARPLPGGPTRLAPLPGRGGTGDSMAAPYPPGGLERNGAAPLVPESVEAVPLPAPETRLAKADADALLKRARDSFLARRYGLAEQSYKAFLAQAGRHPAMADARFELGETYYLQGRYREAGKAYLETYRRHPESRVAPQALLKLGMSLRRLGQKTQACKTWKLLRERFPRSRAARLVAPGEMKRAGCKG